MSLYEILDLVASNYQKIDTLWNFFIWIHLAIIGGIVLLQHRIGLLERVIATGGYLAFAYLNFQAVQDAYAYQIVLLDQAEALGGASKITNYLRAFDLAERIKYIPYVHPTAAFFTVLAIAFINRLR
jgi:hypothetical protein